MSIINDAAASLKGDDANIWIKYVITKMVKYVIYRSPMRNVRPCIIYIFVSDGLCMGC